MRKGEIYLITFKGNDSVQTGLRPVVVVQNNIGNLHSPNTIVCSITSQVKKPLPTHVYIGTSGGLTKKSTVLCEQIQTVCKEDLEGYVGCISDPRTLERLDKGILASLGITQESKYDQSNRYNRRNSNSNEHRHRYSSGIYS